MPQLTAEQKDIKRLRKPAQRVLQALRTHNGVMSRSECWAVAGRALRACQMNKLLQTHLAALVVETEAGIKNIKFPNRTQMLWQLTDAGWLSSGGFPLEGSSVVNAEAVAGLLNRLAATGDKWAQRVRDALNVWDRRSMVDPMPTIDNVRDMLWKMVDGPKKDFARFNLKRMDRQRYLAWEQAQKVKAKEAKKRKKRHRPFTADAIERINAARFRAGELPMELKGRVVMQAKTPTPVEQKPTPVAAPPVVEEKPKEPTKLVLYKDQLDRYYLRDGRRANDPKPEHMNRVQVVEVKWFPLKGSWIELRSGIGWDIAKSALPHTIRAEPCQ